MEPSVYLIGGTSEANRAAERLRGEGYRVVVSVATDLGEGIAASAGMETDTGRKDAAAMASSAAGIGATAIVDCSHPFAREVSREAAAAAGTAGLPYLRYSRPPVAPGMGATGGIEDGRRIDATAVEGDLESSSRIILVDDFEAAAALLRGRGPALLTVGSNNLAPFVEAGIDFTARVLPVTESLGKCARLGIEPSRIIAAWPPFSADFNRACLRRCRADFLVTKDSGREGGLEEKLTAAAAEAAAAVIIRRPPEPEAIHDLDSLVSRLGSLQQASA